jgi:hypothetical protein
MHERDVVAKDAAVTKASALTKYSRVLLNALLGVT